METDPVGFNELLLLLAVFIKPAVKRRLCFSAVPTHNTERKKADAANAAAQCNSSTLKVRVVCWTRGSARGSSHTGKLTGVEGWRGGGVEDATSERNVPSLVHPINLTFPELNRDFGGAVGEVL
ncbi:hypothetical protein EYF80_047754 [Liparis tanakae]|uniref:Uncharacterized protein n=1 Tax=Liparis tanakae TaxID=230148 RepID=A0A4Z2FMQ7_9TELE|nr:hypothetical protein EYF80_047754 [Liparis tanakae]